MILCYFTVFSLLTCICFRYCLPIHHFCLRWNVTGGSAIKGEMEVEYVSAEALKSICLWTDGLINGQWLEQIGSSGCLFRKALTETQRRLKRTCQDNTLTIGANANPLLAQYPPLITLCEACRCSSKKHWPVWFACRWSKGQMMRSVSQGDIAALATPGVLMFLFPCPHCPLCVF